MKNHSLDKNVIRPQLMEIKIIHWNAFPKLVSTELAAIERELSFFKKISFQAVAQVEDIQNHRDAGMTMVLATGHDETTFTPWLKGFQKRWRDLNLQAMPCLIISHAQSGSLREILQSAVDDNWYFDVVDPEHLSSLPLRIANLARSKVHVEELSRMNKALLDVESRLADVESSLRQIGGPT
jgi:hypothetical protein